MRDAKTKLNEQIKDLIRAHPRSDQFQLARRSLEEGKVNQACAAVSNGIKAIKK